MSKTSSSGYIELDEEEVRIGRLQDDDSVVIVVGEGCSCCVESNHPTFRNFKFSALALGVMTGAFIQLSSMATNYLVLTGAIHLSGESFVIPSLLTSLVTSSIAIAMLLIMRMMVSISFKLVSMLDSDNQQDEETVTAVENFVLKEMEKRYIVGTVVSVCFGWTVTALLTGQMCSFMYSAMTLVGALMLCQIFPFLCSSDVDQNRTIDENETKLSLNV